MRGRWLLWLSPLLALGLALAWWWRPVGSAGHHRGPADAVPASYFGFHAHHLNRQTPWPRQGFGAYRAWDARVRWAELQPGPDSWQWQTLDALVSGAEAHRMAVLLPLGMPPRWASAQPDQPSAYGPGEAAMPRELALWQAYVTAVAQRYRGRVQAYEIWNEPNLPNFFSGTPEDAVRLSCSARDILKRIDPQAQLVSPSATGSHGLRWLVDFLRAGGGACVDVIGYHFYLGHQDPERHLPLIRDVRSAMQLEGAAGKPLWNTETGWLIADAGAQVDPVSAGFKPGDRVLTGEAAAGVVGRALLLHWLAGVERFYWYALDNGAMGLRDAQQQPRPALIAYQQLSALLQGRQLLGCQASASLWQCQIGQHGQPLAEVVWSTRPEGETVPLSGEFRALTRLGQSAPQALPKATLQADGVPWILWRSRAGASP